jgi:hypothetical protein
VTDRRIKKRNHRDAKGKKGQGLRSQESSPSILGGQGVAALLSAKGSMLLNQSYGRPFAALSKWRDGTRVTLC